MDMAFVKVLNMSISASWLVLAVLLLRLLLKKSPKWISVALWALVAVRLICPFTPESVMSLVPERATEQMVESISGGYYGDAMIHSQGSANYEAAVTAGIIPSVGDDGYHYVLTQPDDPTKPVHTAAVLYGQIWVAGMVIMLTWAWISYFRLKKKVDASIDVGSGVFICDYIDTPFILGIVKPKIYLPSAMEPDSASHVLAHERAHIARKDHWWKPVGYLLLTVYWFNPVLWLAYILLCRDIELACDEKVIRDMESHQKKAYSEALLTCSVSRRHVAACPLAFGEVGVKERVKTVLNYKKPAFWIVLVAILALIVTAVCFLTDPVKEELRTYRVEEVVYRNPLLSYYMTEEAAPMFQITGDNILRTKEHDRAWKDLGEFSKIKMSDLDFEELFFGLQGKPREDNQEVWMLAVPPEETANSTPFYLLFRQENGVLYLGEGIAFTNVYPLHEHILDATCNVNWLYRLREADSAETWENESPYTWTSTVESGGIRAHSYGGATYSSTFEGSKLDELLSILNGVKEDEIVSRKPEGKDDPLWNYDATWVDFNYADGMWVWIRYVDDTVIIGTESNSDVWKTDGYWVIENEMLTQWMEKVANGGTYMLSDENRAEIRQLLQMEQVKFFDPKEYDDFLFVGCAYDNGRDLGVAVYEPLADGYRLLKLIRGDEVKTCASGSELYYCNYNDLRIFLILNQNITGMEWAGAYEADYAIVTHPGLVVEYFPEPLDAVYRFNYGGGATTMYMDWNNHTHGQAPEYTADTFADPDDAHRICSNLRLNQVVLSWAQEIREPDETHLQGFVNELTRDQTVELLNLLHALPEEAFVEAEMPGNPSRSLEIFMREITAQLSCKLHEDAVYVQYGSGQTLFKSWKIESPELRTFIEGFFTGDTSQWDRFAPYPKEDGQISYKFGDVEIIIPKYAGFQYEVNGEGIRFKPKKESGWVRLKVTPGSLEIDSDTLKVQPGICFGFQAQWGYREAVDIWSFVTLTIPSGDEEYSLLFINEEDAPWVEDFDGEIGWILAVDEIEFRNVG